MPPVRAAAIRRWVLQKGSQKQNIYAVDAHCMPVRVLITASTRTDCKEAVRSIKGISAEALLADHGYDSDDEIDEIVAYTLNAGM